jgi:lactose/L-arabinose transport system permease protein
MDRVVAPRGHVTGWRTNPLENTVLVLLVILVTFGAVVFVLPLYWSIIWATWDTSGIFSFPPKMLPSDKLLTNLDQLQQKIQLARVTLNSLVVVIAHTVGALFFCSLAGFGFAKYRFRGRDVLFYLLLATMTVPSQVTVIPLYIIMVTFGWIDTYQAMIIPGLIPAFGIFLIRQGIEEAVPGELLEAARIDGAGELRIYFQVVLPIIGPYLAALSIFIFSGTWGNFFWPLIVLKSKEMFVLPLALVSIIGEYSQPYGLLMVGSLVMLIPPLLLFVLLQRYFARSLITGAFR